MINACAIDYECDDELSVQECERVEILIEGKIRMLEREEHLLPWDIAVTLNSHYYDMGGCFCKCTKKSNWSGRWGQYVLKCGKSQKSIVSLYTSSADLINSIIIDLDGKIFGIDVNWNKEYIKLDVLYKNLIPLLISCKQNELTSLVDYKQNQAYELS